ncbi:ureidoglycolate lyase [Vibrio tubiashii]|uniref:Ureidoglycolate lyase n=1 Tax=Vibrio tubiashii ATCC 19109 TaxID=1051646 RepID=F9T3K7_9VIBR|nr:ureidoglycolate lyase [Vibrio tubiashii]AIW15676.1 ureidoglycolate hydrolase [Vibrio tubiashii ATCC 19109]EGU56937.1 ureidoglycolate hydrolase [Vibrio tubiashii ATCC 19109]EIF02650.1 ureidoglycolate hydrolase [Vibrio tubiashii NCIMB 1337 = ATCC 19106]
MSNGIRRLTIEPLTKQAFAEFGDVIEVDNSDYFMINNGSTRRYHKLASTDVQEQGGEAIISIFQAMPLSYPLTIKMLERHPLGSQAFVPLLGQPYLIVVAPKGDQPSLKSCRAFLSNGRQGVNYHKGVWHHPVLALTDQDQFLIVDRGGEGHNCDEVYFENDLVSLHLDDLPSNNKLEEKQRMEQAL